MRASIYDGEVTLALRRQIARFGTPEQQERYLPAIVSGEIIAAVAASEPGGGSDVAALATRAERSGKGWVLNGSKTFIANGVPGDLYMVAARTDPRPGARASW